MDSVTSGIAVGIFCKTPAPGYSKTRLSPPLLPEDCSRLSATFIRDTTATIAEVVAGSPHAGCAIYTPAGSEPNLRGLLPAGFTLQLQRDGDLGRRLLGAVEDGLARGHVGVILVNSDSPTLPASILRSAVDALADGAPVVLGPALDGGYTLIGVSAVDQRLFDDIPWSTAGVYRRTLQRADEAGLPVIELPMWYDVDDAMSLGLLAAELAGIAPAFAPPTLRGGPAAATRALYEALRGAGRISL